MPGDEDVKMAEAEPKLDAFQETRDDSLSDEEDDSDINGDGTVIKEVIKEGSDWQTPSKGADVTVHYVGTLTDGTPFDSSRERDQPFKFKLGQGVIQGWSDAVATMKKGEISKFTIKPEKAYGVAGSPPKIPPNATLVFEIELISWTSELDVTKDGGVLKKVLQEGEGYTKPTDCAKVKANYTLKSSSGNVLEEVKEKEWNVDMKEVFEGLDLLIKSMKQGEKCSARIAFNYGFGEKGNDSFKIGPNENLIVEVELLSFENEPEGWDLKGAAKLEAAEKKRLEGNEWFKQGDLERAIRRYEKSKRYMDSDYGLSDEEKKKVNTLKLPIQLNLAQCYIKQRKYKDAIKQCDKALEIEPANVKALFRKGKAFNALDDWEEATRNLKKALEIDPKNKEIIRELQLVKKKQKRQDDRDKARYQGMFSKLAGMTEEDTNGKAKSPVDTPAPVESSA